MHEVTKKKLKLFINIICRVTILKEDKIIDMLLEMHKKIDVITIITYYGINFSNSGKRENNS